MRSLRDSDILSGFRVLLENLNIVLNQLYGIDLIALLCKMVAVSSCGCANFQNPHTGTKILFDVSHRS